MPDPKPAPQSLRAILSQLGFSPLESAAVEVTAGALERLLEGRRRRLERAEAAGHGPPPPWHPPEPDGTPVVLGVIVTPENTPKNERKP